MASPQIFRTFISCYDTFSTNDPSFKIGCCQVRFSVLIFDHSATTYRALDVTHVIVHPIKICRGGYSSHVPWNPLWHRACATYIVLISCVMTWFGICCVFLCLGTHTQKYRPGHFSAGAGGNIV